MIKVAIAEDDFRIADIHEKFLETFNEIVVVGKSLNGEQTLQLLKMKEPDLLLLDVYLPDMLGSELLPLIREKFPKVSIIMITAATDKVFLEKALSYGVENYLIKPVSRERFDDIIQKFIKKHSLLSSNQQVNQKYIDLLFSKGKNENSGKGKGLPKGIDEITLGKVNAVLQAKREGLSAEEVAKEIGASRITARRYLEYLSSVNQLKAEVVYGIVGRPERKYYPI
ncbi:MULTISPECIES: response regulator [Metabacillus]|uniref:Response regulator n=1 Tax=Metabacillus hrfriensis TaxID=3048891 RepID=A0ACD4RA66_9BACI|nr:MULTISPECIES: response regulator [Metabacillus]UAL51813.1 response regulator [Metabacillus dongyingensis]UOK57642.1 response regulator [Bacillus sp. OVS6]USK28121.1 response regulator [Bacillus sp. CMF21]WHZ57327.1 response regulator [Metabacillus sp. CT-WN-B3]